MNIPADFITSLRPLLRDETQLLLSVLEAGNAPVSIRLNPLKTARNPMKPVMPLRQVCWSQWGFYLEKRPAFTFDPLLHSGYYYVQEAASMFVEYITRRLTTYPCTCLDLCAAPGGKSLSLISALPKGSLLVSNEPVRQRANILSETMAKYGHPNVMVTNNTAKDFAGFPSFFDLILVDAPCSGEGMFRKDETAVKEWSLRNVEMCATRQRNILKEVWPALKPGGLLIYSTCTFNITENEENALWAATELGAEFVCVETSGSLGISEISGASGTSGTSGKFGASDTSGVSGTSGTEGTFGVSGTEGTNKEWGISPSFDNRVIAYRFFPHKTAGEGLFVTVLRKGEAEEVAKTPLRKKNAKRLLPFIKDCSVYSDLLLHPGTFHFMENGNHIIALPAGHSDNLIALNEGLKTVSMGIETGERKGKDFIPSHSLAMSAELNPGAFPQFDVSYTDAVSYLRREAIAIADAPPGFVLLTYKGEPLGFVKNLGNRANNLYPGEWRIRSSHLPENTVEIFSNGST